MEDDKFLAQQKEVAFLRKIDEDLDYAFALSLQEEVNDISFLKKTSNNGLHHQPSGACSSKSMSASLGIVDEQWEVIDPNPDIHALFLQYNAQFFYGKLEGVEVRWSPRMTLCAGVCCYEGRGGLCSVRLSVPLLKLRPRKDLVETLLHEMIHAYLFVTVNNKDRDAHGPEFLKHMYRINKAAGTKISVYHSFHDEVDLYRKHWWKCNGPCQKKRPFFGLVKRAMNRAPGPHDTWWSQHQASCGGKFIKIKEPENFKKKSLKRKPLDKPNCSQDIKKFLVSPSLENDSSKDVCCTSKESKGSDDIDFIKSILEKEDNCIFMNNGITNSSSALKSTSNIIPFSGQGFQLGSTSFAGSRSFLANIRKEIASSSNNKNVNSPTKNFHSALPLSSSNLKKPMSEDVKKDTVVNSLLHKTAIVTENDCSGFVQSSIEKFVKPTTGISKSKNSAMISEVQIVHESSSIKVECPVCFQSFTNLDINTHLDSCLS